MDVLVNTYIEVVEGVICDDVAMGVLYAVIWLR